MSKSKGNVVTPMGLLQQHGSDAVRYWAASARLGSDAAFEEGQMKIGRRLAIKLLNASKFALSFLTDDVAAALTLDLTQVTAPLDRAMLTRLGQVVDAATSALAAYDHTKALEITETFFWTFCDDYIELVKDRTHGSGGAEAAASARTALGLALEVLLRLFAPFQPFATEEVWSWFHESSSSVHAAPWPRASELTVPGDPAVLDLAGQVLGLLRKVKSQAKVSQRTEITTAQVAVPHAYETAVQGIFADVKAAGRAVNLVIKLADVTDPELISATLAEHDA